MLAPIATASSFQRARTQSEKAQRREMILSAARELGISRGVRNVTLGDVADRVGLAKSSLLRYFETREDIYLQITADCWREWSQAARADVRQAVPGPAGVADALTQTLGERPLFCDLLAHTEANLEHNVSTRAALTLRIAAVGAVRELAGAIVVSVPAMGETAAADIVVLTTMLAGSIWQRANPPLALAAAFERDREKRRTCLVFDPSLRHVVRALIEGGGAREQLLTYTPSALTTTSIDELTRRSSRRSRR